MNQMNFVEYQHHMRVVIMRGWIKRQRSQNRGLTVDNIRHRIAFNWPSLNGEETNNVFQAATAGFEHAIDGMAEVSE